MPDLDSVLVVAMVCMAGYGALRLPSHARIPVHFGPLSWQTSVPKTPGLVLWVAVGVVTWLTAGLLASPRAGGAAERVGLTLALATILVAQAVAVGLAVVRSRRG
jgi:hypothetical protein